MAIIMTACGPITTPAAFQRTRFISVCLPRIDLHQRHIAVYLIKNGF
jgi:hypothetical protein